MASDRLSLKGKVAIITGASSGIGKATALLFAERGAQLILTGRNNDNLEAVRKECLEQCTVEHHSFIADMTQEEDVKKLIDFTIDKLGKIDVLVNNAGILETGSIETMSLESYDRVMNINLRSIVHLTMLAVPHLKKTKGNIVNVSSVTGLRAFPGVLAYNMSKSALDQMTRTIALELAPYEVRVNSVNPGVIETEVHKRAGMTDEAYAKFLEHCKSTHALGRHGNPFEVADAIAFLASDASSFITAVQFPIDGGRHAMCPR